MTSSDVLDTCLALQLAQASDLLLADLEGLLSSLERRAKEHKYTLCLGRSHGIHAEPTTFGLKLAGTMRPSPAAGDGWRRRAGKSRPAPSPGPWVPSPISTRGS